jgi:transposase-like protein
MLFALPSMLRAVLTVLARRPAAIVTDAATRSRMMRLTPWTPPLPPAGRPAVVVGPEVAVGRWDCGDCDLPFRVSVGTERSADLAPMRRAL